MDRVVQWLLLTARYQRVWPTYSRLPGLGLRLHVASGHHQVMAAVDLLHFSVQVRGRLATITEVVVSWDLPLPLCKLLAGEI